MYGGRGTSLLSGEPDPGSVLPGVAGLPHRALPELSVLRMQRPGWAWLGTAANMLLSLGRALESPLLVLCVSCLLMNLFLTLLYGKNK